MEVRTERWRRVGDRDKMGGNGDDSNTGDNANNRVNSNNRDDRRQHK